jgi:hypothetical protein
VFHTMLHLIPFIVFGVIGLQRAIVQTVLTTAAGATGQTGDVFAIPQDWSASDAILYQYVVTGGTFSALHVKLELSLDGVNFPVANVDDTTFVGNIGIVEIGSTLVASKAPFLRAEISGGVVATGSPIVTVKVWPR